MPVKYIPYVPNTIEGQAILDNITRTRRVLRYQDNGKVYERIKRGLPLYEAERTETVGASDTQNLLLRGECLSACAYLKDKGIALDLVYIDPPFASGADYAKSVYLRRNPKKAEAVAQAEAELELDELRAFEEKMYGDIWNKEDYLNWMFENLTAIKSVMSETASIYVHLDWRIGHYVKVLLDETFGESNYRNDIRWRRQPVRGGKATGSQYARNSDNIFFYTRMETHIWNNVYKEYSAEFIKEKFRLDDKGRLFRDSDLGNYSADSIADFEAKGKIYLTNTGKKRLIRYLDEEKGEGIGDIWSDIPEVNSQAKEDTGYSTQKPKELLRRIIKASSDEGMTVGDFFGGSGVTARVSHELGRRFIHVDVGVNSLQTARDELKAEGASFQVLDIQDGVSLFRNPAQTMDKLKTLIVGLKNEDGLDKFWEGAIQDSKLGLMPVYLPNLLDHQTKVLDVPLINRVIQEALPDLPDSVKQAIVYYVDIYDRDGVEAFIKEHNATGVQIELRDLKTILDDVVLNDEAEWERRKTGGVWEVELVRFASDRLQSKIDEYNQKKGLTGKAKAAALDMDADEETDEAAPPKKTPFKPIQISDNGLELIEWLSVDCTNADGAWQSDSELKIDKKGYVIRDGKKTKDFWNAKITSKQKPLRLKLRNIAGDESILPLTEQKELE